MNEVEQKFFISHLEKLGTQKVRELMLASKYDIYQQKPIVESWLREKELEIDKESISLSKEANNIARSAKNASWGAICVSIISIIISILVAIIK